MKDLSVLICQASFKNLHFCNFIKLVPVSFIFAIELERFFGLVGINLVFGMAFAYSFLNESYVIVKLLIINGHLSLLRFDEDTFSFIETE
jgi:hypothetical protein